MTYLELFNQLKAINNNTYLDEIIYEFIYDKHVFDLLTFIENRNTIKRDAKKVIKKFSKVIKQNIPWERVLKYCYFYGLKLKLNDGVFSPRKDTEFLVDCFLNDNKDIQNKSILDLGTGTGCISLAIANNIHDSNKIFGYENNPDAYKNTLINFKKYKKQIKLFKKDYLKLIQDNNLVNVDYIVCNPPYINEEYELEENVFKYDPISALFSNGDEVKYYKKIINYFVNSNASKVYFEIGYNQKEMLENYLRQFDNLKCEFKEDLNEIDRVLIISK